MPNDAKQKALEQQRRKRNQRRSNDPIDHSSLKSFDSEVLPDRNLSSFSNAPETKSPSRIPWLPIIAAIALFLAAMSPVLLSPFMPQFHQDRINTSGRDGAEQILASVKTKQSDKDDTDSDSGETSSSASGEATDPQAASGESTPAPSQPVTEEPAPTTIQARTVPLVAGHQGEIEIMTANTRLLQQAIDDASNAGGGEVFLPQGEFYFYPLDEWDEGLTGGIRAHRIIKCRDNVALTGTGAGKDGTVLFPYKPDDTLATDMFYFNDLQEGSANYLRNAVFKNFRIDGWFATYDVRGNYNARGKGFFINLFDNCHWENVTVKNTQGTGFGMDCPINSSIKNCLAIYCGNWGYRPRGERPWIGGSGFGIGCGYVDGESILIENCRAVGNSRFGFFFEHQKRFDEGLYRASMSAGNFQVSNCAAMNNQWDFGGETAYCVTYTNCVSTATGLAGETYDEANNPLNVSNVASFFFKEQVDPRIPSENIVLVNCAADNSGNRNVVYENNEYALVAGGTIHLP